MSVIYVGKGRRFQTITEALEYTNYDEALTLILDEGIYREKIECNKRKLHLIGRGMNQTYIIWDDSAFKLHLDGKKYGTFRSHTAFFDGDYLKVENLTIENQAGQGHEVGQAVAAAVYTKYVHMKYVRLISYQDTLFLGPLPDKERVVDGFLGPRQDTPRIQSYQFYENCEIQGDIDFIFGGGNGIFSNCILYGRGERIGFLTAPSTNVDELGFYFDKCIIDAQVEQNLYLGRPWRRYGKSMFFECVMGKGIHKQGFDPWQEKKKTYFFAEWPEQETKRLFQTYVTIEEVKIIQDEVSKIKKAIKSLEK
ncbi:pectinesterase family protein [Niameybacter massiliensis]|uniref:Pectinesterase n=1 Tax=Holtiella tumoricola TaxID=3018743 RepID=A0AA42DPZ3_9FIRM|nr:pectinesterase family protein [Holtiella tumoricola]MDA3732716.1 pectinesterase family protein [Holtiella tumoricola]